MKTVHTSLAPRMKVAIIGQGCAGLASAYHLLQLHRKNDATVHIDMFDAFGIGSGATGVAAGLLHPFGVSGKLLWQGLPAYKKAAELVEESQSNAQDVFYHTKGLFRPARNDKQRRQFAENIGWNPREDLLHAHCLPFKKDTQDDTFREEGRISGFYIPHGIVINTKKYLEAVWNLCLRQAQESGSIVATHRKTITALEDLHDAYDAIIVATGAAIDEIEELRNILKLDLCQGYTVEISQNEGCHGSTKSLEHPQSILGNPYIAFHGHNRAIVGATQTHGISSLDAFNICKTGLNDTSEEAYQAASGLLTNARAVISDLDHWDIATVRSGVRALPTRTHQGSIPYAGKFRDNCWILAGLGARGLVYHAWLGMITASSIFFENDIISVEYPELTRWKE